MLLESRYTFAMIGPLHITASYAFFPLEEEQMSRLREELLIFGSDRGMKGLTLIAPEGINATVSGTAQSITEWKARLRLLNSGIVFKDSTAEKPIYRRWSVKLKPEIVLLRQKWIHPQGKHRHLSPEDWNAMLGRGDVVLLDARNDYEVALGKFSGAIDPKIKKFHQFPAFLKRAELPKEKTVLMYCTGGIRCEKALLAMEAQGYSNVYQLEGGILAYLEKFPHLAFEGECFVFDKRVAVTQELAPSTVYWLCSGCGDPAKGEACERCLVRV